jgi:L-2-hydroxyglutarate oxidase
VNFDIIIIGGGIVGLSTAWQLQQQRPGARILLLEKETGVARHQSGRNSGVIHAGVYYPPGSLKAQFCREGAAATYAFCEEHGLPCKRTGKLLVATNETELERMRALFERCRDNRLEPEWLSSSELKVLEPAVTGSGAFLVRESGITDYAAICRQMLNLFIRAGGTSTMAAEVTAIHEAPSDITVQAANERYSAGQLVVCSGLMADRLALMQGLGNSFRVIPFRGEYFRLRSELNTLVRHLIYPIPDPELPFLGVHLTRMIDGSMTVGPNAIQGWKREGYGSFNFDWRDTREMLGFPGFWKLASANLGHGIRETWNSVWKRGYLAQVRKYCPQIRLSDLRPYRVGIRAQVVLADGTMVHDFLFQQTPRSLHVINAPSPAATSAIPIGRYICKKVAELA